MNRNSPVGLLRQLLALPSPPPHRSVRKAVQRFCPKLRSAPFPQNRLRRRHLALDFLSTCEARPPPPAARRRKRLSQSLPICFGASGSPGGSTRRRFPE